jgi:hypothetical protein
VEQQTRAAAEQIVFRDYMLSVSQVPADYPSAAELQQAYDSGKAQWVTPPLYRVSQIFLAVNDPQNLDAVRRQAQDLSRGPRPRRGFRRVGHAVFPGPGHRRPRRRFGVAAVAATGAGGARRGLAAQGRRGVGRGAKRGGFHVLKLTAQQPARTATLDELRERLTQALRPASGADRQGVSGRHAQHRDLEHRRRAVKQSAGVNPAQGRDTATGCVTNNQQIALAPRRHQDGSHPTWHFKNRLHPKQHRLPQIL